MPTTLSRIYYAQFSCSRDVSSSQASFVRRSVSFVSFLYSHPFLFRASVHAVSVPSSLLSSVICFFPPFVRSFVRSCGDAGSRSACALRVCFPAAQVFPVCNARLLSVKQSTFARVLFFLSFLFLSSLVAVRPETKGAFQSRRNLRKLTGLCERCLATRHHLTSKTDTVWVFANRTTPSGCVLRLSSCLRVTLSSTRLDSTRLDSIRFDIHAAFARSFTSHSRAVRAPWSLSFLSEQTPKRVVGDDLAGLNRIGVS